MTDRIIRGIFILIGAGLISCSQTQDPNALEGYWEIEKVIFPDGQTKEYTISMNLDHYQLETDSTGYKTKVSPRLDGSFLSSGHREFFRIEQRKNEMLLHFETPLTQYTEKVLSLKKEQLILLNDRNMKYTYKPYTKIELE